MVRPPFGTGTEGLCQTMPDLGTIPFMPDRALNRRVVRLVSNSTETDLSIELKAGLNKIGRQRVDNHIVLVGPEISRFHAEIEVNEDSILIRDLGSSNGTYVNDQRVKEERLQAGDIVAFSEQFSFQLLIDIALETPESVTLSPSRDDPMPSTDPPEPVPFEEDAVPTSLKRRSQRLEKLASEEIPVPSGRHEPTPSGYAPVEPPRASPSSASSSYRPPSTQKPIPQEPVVPTPSSPSSRRQRRSGRHRQAAEPVAPSPSKPAPLGEVASSSRPTTAVPAATRSSPEQLIDEVSGSILTDEPDAEVAVLERERRQLAVLYQVSKRCMSAESLAELDRLLINVLERIVAFDRGFITYQLPSGDWKLVMSPKGDRWERKVVRKLLQTALKAKAPVTVYDSRSDDTLGSAGQGRTDSRLLLPLRSRSSAVGTIFLIASRADAFDEYTVDFLSLFSDIAALAVVNCAKLEAG